MSHTQISVEAEAMQVNTARRTGSPSARAVVARVANLSSEASAESVSSSVGGESVIQSSMQGSD